MLLFLLLAPVLAQLSATARFDDDLGIVRILITFSKGVRLKDTSDACIFTKDSLSLLQNRTLATCFMDSTSRLMVFPGYGATILPKDLLEISDGALRDLDSNQPIKGIPPFNVSLPSSLKSTVTVGVTFASTLFQCSDVVLDGSGTAGLLYQPALFSWRIVRMESTGQSSYLNRNAIDLRQLRFPYGSPGFTSMWPDTYKGTLRVQNFFQQSGDYSWTFFRVGYNGPDVIVNIPQTISTGSQFIASATLQYSEDPLCTAPRLYLPPNNLTYSWLIKDLGFTGQGKAEAAYTPDEARRIQTPQPGLLVARGWLNGCRVYMVELTVGVPCPDQSKCPTAMLYLKSQAYVSVGPQVVNAVIAPVPEVLGLSDELRLDGTNSMLGELADVTSLAFRWSCVYCGASTPCEDSRAPLGDTWCFTDPSVPRNMAAIVISPDQLSPQPQVGYYLFTLRVTPAVPAKSACALPSNSTSIRVQITLTSPPFTLTIEGPRVVNPSDYLRLSAVTTAAQDEVNWNWKETLRKLQFNSRLVSKPNSPSFVLLPNTLSPGTSYLFSVTAVLTKGNHSLSAQLLVSVAQPPIGGDCVVTPLQGEAMSTWFSASCSGWQGTGLRYSFAFVAKEGDQVVSDLQYQANARFLLPAGAMYLRATIQAFDESTTEYLFGPVSVHAAGSNSSDGICLLQNLTDTKLKEAMDREDVLFVVQLITVMTFTLIQPIADDTIVQCTGDMVLQSKQREFLWNTFLRILVWVTQHDVTSTIAAQLGNLLVSLTQSLKTFDEQSRGWALEILGALISKLSVRDSLKQGIANVLSTLLTEASCAQVPAVASLLLVFTQHMAQGKLPEEKALQLLTATFEVYAIRSVSGGSSTYSNGLYIGLEANTGTEDSSLVVITRYGPDFAKCLNSTSGLRAGDVISINTLDWRPGMFVEFELPFDRNKLPSGPACMPAPAPRCEWWDFNTSAWYSHGCSTISSSLTSIRCRCSHLTDFSVIVR